MQLGHSDQLFISLKGSHVSLKNSFLEFFLYVWVLCLHVCLYTTCETCIVHQISWNWRYRWLWATVWLLGILPSSLEEQLMLLINDPSLQPCLYASSIEYRLFVWGRSPFSSLIWLGLHSVVQPGLKHSTVFLPQLSKYWGSWNHQVWSNWALLLIEKVCPQVVHSLVFSPCPKCFHFKS